MLRLEQQECSCVCVLASDQREQIQTFQQQSDSISHIQALIFPGVRCIKSFILQLNLSKDERLSVH